MALGQASRSGAEGRGEVVVPLLLTSFVRGDSRPRPMLDPGRPYNGPIQTVAHS